MRGAGADSERVAAWGSDTSGRSGVESARPRVTFTSVGCAARAPGERSVFVVAPVRDVLSAYVRFGGWRPGGREPYQGTYGSRGASGNHPTYPPPPIEREAEKPPPAPTKATSAGE